MRTVWACWDRPSISASDVIDCFQTQTRYMLVRLDDSSGFRDIERTTH